MQKWYETDARDEDIVISSRIRLARNFKKYPFSFKLGAQEAQKMINEAKGALMEDKTVFSKEFQYVDLSGQIGIDRLAMMERRMISPELAKKPQPCGVLVKNDETISIMLNEEDHLRIQSVAAGMDIDKAWDLADKIDDLLEESIEYAFDEQYGYLTSCPTNVGTGLRASYMIHIPALEATGQLQYMLQAISKLGMTVRGIYGEGTEALGSIYQISNQITLGQAEEDIIKNLKHITNQIIEQENKIRERFIKEQRMQIEDQLYRSYGILTNARVISGKEAMGLLSDIKLGYAMGLLEKTKPDMNIFQIMVYCQLGNLQKYIGRELSVSERDEARARFIRERFTV